MAWQHYDFCDDLRTARAGHTATAVGKYVYVLGGRRGGHFFRDLIRFDTDTHEWETVYEDLPFVARANHTATLVEAGPSGGREVWFVGGQTNDDVVSDCWALELDSELAWRQVHVRDERSLLMRTAHTVDVHPRNPNHLLIFGGYGGPGEYMFMHGLVTLDVATGDVTELRPSGVPPSPRAYHTCTAVGHMFYVFGGRNSGGVIPDSDPTLLCCYDALQNTWRALSPGAGAHGRPPCPRSSHRAVAFTGRVVLFGGTPASGGGPRERMADIHTLFVAPSGDVVWSACDDPGGDPRDRPAGRSAHSMVLVGQQDAAIMGGYAGGGNAAARSDGGNRSGGSGGAAGAKQQQGKGQRHGQQYSQDVWVLRLDRAAPLRCAVVQRVRAAAQREAVELGGGPQRQRQRAAEAAAVVAGAGAAAANAGEATSRKRGLGRRESPHAAAANGEWNQIKRQRQGAQPQQQQQQLQQRATGEQHHQHPLLRGRPPEAGAAPDQLQPPLPDAAPPGSPTAAAAATLLSTPAAAPGSSPRSQPRSPEYAQGRADGYAEALIRRDNATLREALEAERRANAVTAARAADLERQLGEAHAHCAGAEAALQSARDEAHSQRRRADAATSEAQREAERRLAAEARACAAEGEKREEAASGARLAAQLGEARRHAKERSDEAAALQASLDASRREARAAADAAKRELDDAEAERARMQAELANERARASASDQRTSRLAEALQRAEEGAKSAQDQMAAGDKERSALQQQLASEKAAAEAARGRGDEAERQLAASRQEVVAAKAATAGKEAQVQALQAQLSRLQADHQALSSRLAAERERAADDTAQHRRALQGQLGELEALVKGGLAALSGAMLQEFNRADTRRAEAGGGGAGGAGCAGPSGAGGSGRA